ncbi:MAG: hypothetical protein JXL81_01330 [Deltaproteobacteria bacterium]|nr:hypothetical protein [Deltaproteobacteria bacterium]
MGKLIKKYLSCVFVLLFSVIFSNLIIAKEVTGIIIKKEMGMFELKLENSEILKIYTGKKVTKYNPDNYRTLLDDKVKVTYDMQPLRYGGEAGNLKPVAQKIEPVIKGSNHIDNDIICEINEIGKRWVKATLVDRPFYVRLELWNKQTEYFPEGYNPVAGDIVSIYLEQRGDSWADKYRYLIWEMRKVSDNEKEKCLDNIRIRKQLRDSSMLTPAEELFLDLNSIHFTGIRNSARLIAESDYHKNKRFTDKIAEILKSYIAEPDESDIAVDAMSWCCIALHKSMNRDYTAILNEIKSSKIDGDIRKYAKKALKAFKKSDVQI